MSKIYSIYSLISLLSEGKKKNLKELSSEIGISQTMVRKYFDELEKLGIYVESIKGRNGGYYISSSYYKVPSLPFTKEDIKILESMKEIDSVKLNIVISKIKTYVENNNNKIIEENLNKYKKEYYDFKRAIIEKKKILLFYFSPSEKKITERIIVPKEIFIYDNEFYLFSFCELRNSMRQFKFELIKKYKIL